MHTFSQPKWVIPLSVLMLATSYHVVWYTGGTSLAFTHLFYIPIIFTALLCSWRASLVTAVISGMLLSRWLMPLSRAPLILQEPQTWLFRIFLFITVSLWTSLVFAYLKRIAAQHQAEKEELNKLLNATLHALVDLTELRDPDVTGHHCNRLSHYTTLITTYLNLDQETSTIIAKSISLHDIGKVAIPDRILNKPGPLSSEEWKIMREHPNHGARILDQITKSVQLHNPTVQNYLKIAREIILHHHEKWDGSGYPSGLKTTDIPLSARIAALCDVYDSLRSQRPYKTGLNHQQAIDIIAAGKSQHFDPQLVDAFMELHPKFDEVWQKYGNQKKIAQKA